MTFKPEPTIDFWDIFVTNDYWFSVQGTGDTLIGEPEYGEELLSAGNWEETSYKGNHDEEIPFDKIYSEYCISYPPREFVAVPTHPIYNNWIVMSREYSGV